MHFQHDLHSRGNARHLLDKIEVECPKLLWIRLGGPNCGTGNKHDTLRATHICQIADAQLNAGRALIIEANSRNLAWQLRAVQQFIPKPQVSDHHWCAHERLAGVKRHYCRSTVRIATNVNLGREFLCDCPQQTPHVNSKDMTANEFQARYNVVLRSIAERVVCGCPSMPLQQAKSLKEDGAVRLHTQPESIFVPKSQAQSYPASQSSTSCLAARTEQNSRHSMMMLSRRIESDARRLRTSHDFAFATCSNLIREVLDCTSLQTSHSVGSSPDSGSANQIISFGLDCMGSNAGITYLSQQLPETTRYLNQFGAFHCATPPWNMILVSDAAKSLPHQAVKRLPGSIVQTIGVGDYSGGDECMVPT